MFWTEEDISPVVKAAEVIFGVNGNMSNEPNVVKNVCIVSPRLGKIWYGDVDGGMATLTKKTEILAKNVNEPLFLDYVK